MCRAIWRERRWLRPHSQRIVCRRDWIGGQSIDGSTNRRTGGKETTFIGVTLCGRTAENVAEYLAKGRAVLDGGRLQTDSPWEDKGDWQASRGVEGGVRVDAVPGGGGERSEQKARNSRPARMIRSTRMCRFDRDH